MISRSALKMFLIWQLLKPLTRRRLKILTTQVKPNEKNPYPFAAGKKAVVRKRIILQEAIHVAP
jgi:hypothetical protein